MSEALTVLVLNSHFRGVSIANGLDDRVISPFRAKSSSAYSEIERFFAEQRVGMLTVQYNNVFFQSKGQTCYLRIIKDSGSLSSVILNDPTHFV